MANRVLNLKKYIQKFEKKKTKLSKTIPLKSNFVIHMTKGI